MIPEVPWKRFWCRREDSYSLADSGFLVDPEGKYGSTLNPKLVGFDQLRPISCLALLGEPGIGKSSSLDREANSSGSCPAGSATIRVDLRGYGSENRLMSALFDSSSFKQWESGTSDLYLYLDSLDECLLRIDNVASLLADELPKHSLTRLKLRIACRTASWPPLLERALTEAYGAGSFAAYELAPLRRCDVELALSVAGVQDVGLFLKRIEDLNIESFAIKPITLGFLIETFLREGDLPTRALDLYERGCQILCEEQNESRRASGKTGSLAPVDRMAIASRIAAATQLGNRYAVWTGTQAVPYPPEDIPIESIAVGSEADTRGIPLTRAFVLEALDTGLFSSRGQERLGWAHQTLAEYLAARFCIRHSMPIQQLRTILFHPRRGRIVPQLREVASWIALQHPELFQEISQLDPEVLLGSAAPNLTDVQRAVVTDALLRLCNEGQFIRLITQIDPLLRNLSYSGLGSQIGPTIRDKGCSEVARHLAIDIARRCNVVELANAIADIALDSDEPPSLRNSAAFTIGQIGDQDTKARLKPLVVDQEDDTNQERKGAALLTLWPGLIGADELFACLTSRRAPNTYGLYRRFLEYSVLPNLKPEDLPAALRWYSAQQHEFHGPFEDLLHGILELALEHVDEGNNAFLLAQALEPRIRTQQMINSGNLATPFEAKLGANIEKRHSLLNALLPLIGGCQTFALFHPLQLVYAEDFDWLIARIVNGRSPASIDLEVAAVIRFCCSWESTKLNAVWQVSQQSPELADRFRGLFEPAMLDSEMATYERRMATERAKRQPTLLTPPPSERIEQRLAQSEHGIPDAWLGVTCEMSLEPTSTHYKPYYEMEIEKLPGWVKSGDATRARIRQAAKRYLEYSPFRAENWFPSSSVPVGATSAVNALALLYAQEMDFLVSRSSEFWVPWVSSILADLRNPEADSVPITQLLQMANSAAAAEVIRCFVGQVSEDSSSHGYFLCESKLETVWSPLLEKRLIELIQERVLKNDALRGLLVFLFKKNSWCARKWAEENVDCPNIEEDIRVAIASALVTGTRDAAWSAVWPQFEQDPQFGRSVLERVSYIDPAHVSFTRCLTDADLGKLYLWLLEQYPVADTDYGRSGAMGPGDTIRFLREGCLEQLKQRASFEACDGLANTMTRFPDYKWLQFHLDEAEALACAATWRALPVDKILEAAVDSRKRLVESSVQLLDVVVESLERLQRRLHDELPAVQDLWNSTTKGECWPKDEQDLSNYVARHLREDLAGRGIIANREVQIRRGRHEEMTGQSTDIHVDAVTGPTRMGETYGPVSLIIEVKGSWNQGLFLDMQNQLRDRYLRNNQCRIGLYCVVHFAARNWPNTDYRRERCSALAIDNLRETLENQADSLSGGALIRSYVLDANLDSTTAKLTSPGRRLAAEAGSEGLLP